MICIVGRCMAGHDRKMITTTEGKTSQMHHRHTLSPSPRGVVESTYSVHSGFHLGRFISRLLSHINLSRGRSPEAKTGGGRHDSPHRGNSVAVYWTTSGCRSPYGWRIEDKPQSN